MSYIYITTPILAWFVSQGLKCVFQYFKQSKLDLSWRLFICSGGMPSAHSATTASLATLIGLKEGFDSPVFATAALLCLIVAYDACGVRKASGKQATYLNILVDELRDELTSSDQLERLKTEIGHSTIQVLAGLATGILIAFCVAKSS